jgi:peroxiredoxin
MTYVYHDQAFKDSVPASAAKVAAYKAWGEAVAVSKKSADKYDEVVLAHKVAYDLAKDNASKTAAAYKFYKEQE